MENKLKQELLIVEEVFKIQNSLNTILRLTGHTDLELRVGNKDEADKMNNLYEEAVNKIAQIISPPKD